ncbi:related to zinc-containing alcohol dehydrogenase [Phialocephala subalpina]|uniref:Related to zinc-containing alcohol dehydrogenase n=1 Tax=Phialocephala subalpina TaxID=576137 RepID=A0A1L7XD91_9HELO|nr:related to zinc-containing alcohol dehydrogenase [Phialocephala subalpina]
MSSQTVFRFPSGDGIDSLQTFIEPIPIIDKNEILIKVRSIALNYRDVAIATSTYPLPVKDQVIPCSDMAGEVTQVGDLVTRFSVGDSVLAPINPAFLYGPLKDEYASDSFGGPKDGMLREYIALQAHAVIKLPKSSHNFADWAAVVCTGSTVWNAFYGNTALKPGDTVLLLGTGGVSLTALIFAKAAGATTIITSSSDKKLEYVKSKFGADYTINYKTHPNWAAEVQRITNGHGVNHILEINGAATIEQSLGSVARGGVVSVIGWSQAPEKMPDVAMLSLRKGCAIRGVQGGSKQQLEESVRFMGNRELLSTVEKTFGFEKGDIIAALKYVASGEHIGKVCISLK